ncbi:MAG: hypothetical protein O3C63_01700 [Cyanobacteria bacterium]|nr:hypothetical protein [Cyanobacteriota bacterium]MDA1020025.1 hypothetical protein [Cyanobacteriota bacterium]
MSITGSIRTTVKHLLTDGVVAAAVRFVDPSKTAQEARDISRNFFHKNTFAENTFAEKSRSVATSMAHPVTPNLAI